MQQNQRAMATLFPAANVSWHQQGLAVDFGINTNAPYNGQIRSAMTAQGMTWGGPFKPKPDPVHYQQPPAGERSPGQLEPNCPVSLGGN